MHTRAAVEGFDTCRPGVGRWPTPCRAGLGPWCCSILMWLLTGLGSQVLAPVLAPAHVQTAAPAPAPAPAGADVPKASAPITEADARRISDAVTQAYSLEHEYWRNPARFGDWESLYAHYRRGFSASIAGEMTDFTLGNAGDLATWIPSDVHVVHYDGDVALAWFRTPQDFIEGAWSFQPYMVVRLRRESSTDGERWIVDWATDSATQPAP